MDPRYVFGFVVIVLILISIVIGANKDSVNRTPARASRIETPNQGSGRRRDVPEASGRMMSRYDVPEASGRMMSKGEAECRRVLERIYGVAFPTVHPGWLISTETKRNLELDCYAEVDIGLTRKVAIACEYQGEQHYRRVPTMQLTDAAFQAQEWNDEYKRQMCEIHGVHLIIVPYTVKRNDIRGFITNFLSERSLLPR